MTTNSETMDYGGLDFEVRSISAGHASHDSTGNTIYDGTDDSINIPAALFASTDTQVGAGAISILTVVTNLQTDSADALTLADGAEGQLKTIVMTVDMGDGTLTPANFGNGSTLTFDAVGESATLVFLGSNWWIVALNGATLA